MDDFENIEEPPPIHRYVASDETHRKPRSLIAWSGRPSSSSRAGRNVSPPPVSARTSSRRDVILLALAGLVVFGVQGWFLHRARADLVAVQNTLAQQHKSLGVLWESTKRLDEDKMARLALLADSIRQVSDYTQGEVRLWEASYATLQTRLDENKRHVAKTDTSVMRLMRSAYTRMEGLTRADQSALSRLEMLERQDRTHNTAVEALYRRTQSQEGSIHDVSSLVAALRDALEKVDNDLGTVQQRVAQSSSAYGQLGRRVDNLAGFADGFRRAGLNGDAVSGQLSSLSDELRRIRIRVDSLRGTSRTVMSGSSSDRNRED